MIKNCIKYFINSLGVSSYNFETSRQLLSLVFMEFELNIVIKLNDSIRQDWELNDLMEHVEQIFSIRIKRMINLQSNGILDDIITHLYTLSFSTNIRYLTQNFPNSIDNYWSNFKEKEGLVYIEEFEINKSYWDSYEFFLFLGGLLRENMKKSINTNFFQCEVPLKDSFDLEILSSNTKIRRLGYLKLLLKYFNENGRVPVSKTNLDFERYCQSYNEYLSLYKNRKGNIILTKTGNSAAPYIELGISLGLIHKSMGYYELGKIGKVYGVLRKNLRESNGENPFVLSPFEQSFFLENILRQDYFFIYTILELSYVNYSISYLSLKKIFQEKLLSNMDLCIEYAKLNNPGKFLSLRTVKKRISEWNKSESYLEHVLMPRLNWLYDLNIIDLKDDLSFSLTTSGKRLFYNLTIGKDLALHMMASLDAYIDSFYMKVLNEIYGSKNKMFQDGDYKMFVAYLDQSFYFFRTLAPNRVTFSLFSYYIRYILFYNHSIVLDTEDIKKIFAKKEYSNYIYRFQEQYKDGYIQKR